MAGPNADGLSYILDDISDNFTIPPDFLDPYPGGLIALSGDDTVFGSEESEAIYGNQGSDRIFGNNGNDTLSGGLDSDSLNGGNGDDVLIGDFDRDTLTGEEGADTFVLRSFTLATNPDNADVITDFDRNSDRIALTGGLTEADVVLEARSRTPGSSDTLIRYADAEGILGWAIGVSPEDLSGRFTSVSFVDELLGSEEIINFNVPTLTQLSENSFALEFASDRGDRFVSTIQKTEDRIYQDSIRFTPSPSDPPNLAPFTASINPEGTQIDLQFDGSPDSLRIEKINQESARVSLETPNGETEVAVVPIVPIQDDPFAGFGEQLQNELLCSFGQGFCNALGFMGSVAGFFSAVTAPLVAAGIPASPTISALGTITKIAGYTCTALFGGDGALVSTVLNEIPFGKLAGRLGGPLLKLGGVNSVDEIFNFGKSILNLNSSIEMVTGEAPPDNPDSSVLESIRERLGLDICDDPMPSQSPTPSPDPLPPIGDGVTEVTVVIEASSGFYATRELFLEIPNRRFIATPPNSGLGIDNDFGKTINLGELASGTELVFGLNVQPFSGRQPVGAPYTIFSNNPSQAELDNFSTFSDGITRIGFEDGWVPGNLGILDLPESNDDFDDTIIQVTGALVRDGRIIVS